MPDLALKTDPIARPDAIIGGDSNTPYRFTVLTTGLIRLEYASDCTFEDRASTFAIFRNLPCPQYRVSEEENSLEIITTKFHLKYDKQPFTPNGLTIQVKGSFTEWQSKWRFGVEFETPDYWLGGTARTLDNADGRIALEPGVITRSGISEINDSSSMLFTEDNWVAGRKPGNRHDLYIFAYGHDYEEALRVFYQVSGRQPLIPRWALGNWWSRYYAYTDTEYLTLMDKFEQERVPLSVSIIDMDWHWTAKHEIVKKSGTFGWTGYSWNTELFRNPKDFISELSRRNLKVALNDHPADGICCYEDAYDEVCKELGKDANTKDPIAFDVTDKVFMNVYLNTVLRKLEEDGLRFWWVDWQQGQYSAIAGVDPLWVLNHLHFFQNAKGGKRPMTFSRYAGPGSHRYPIGFSGDSLITWESLDFQPEFTASASNIGYGWWSHDIGGHMKGYRDDELIARWVQLGALSPILRLHSSNNLFSSKEPWNFSSDACETIKAAMRLRHRLIPYVYSCNVESASGGLPLVRPLYWKYPDRHEAYRNKNVYWFGPDLIAAPLTSRRASSTQRAKANIWLPPGHWTDLFSNLCYSGDRDICMYRKLADTILLAKEGSITPFDDSELLENGAANPKALEIKVVVGADGYFDLFEDDGKGEDFSAVTFVKTHIHFNQGSGEFKIDSTVGNLAAIPPTRDWKVTFMGLDSSQATNLEQEMKVSKDKNGSISVTFKQVPTSTAIKIGLGPSPPRINNEVRDILFETIREFQIDFDLKAKLWDIITKPINQSPSRCISTLRALGLDQEVSGVIEELLFAQ